MALLMVGPARTDMCRPTVTGVLKSWETPSKVFESQSGALINKDLVDRDGTTVPPTAEGVWKIRGGMPRWCHSALVACGARLHTGWEKVHEMIYSVFLKEDLHTPPVSGQQTRVQSSAGNSSTPFVDC